MFDAAAFSRGDAQRTMESVRGTEAADSRGRGLPKQYLQHRRPNDLLDQVQTEMDDTRHAKSNSAHHANQEAWQHVSRKRSR